MSDDSVNEMTRIYSQVLSMRTNAPKDFAPPSDAEEFNILVDRAEVVRGEDLSEFRFRKTDITDPSTEGRSGGSRFIRIATYTRRIDAFLNYVRGTLPSGLVSKIGFPTT